MRHQLSEDSHRGPLEPKPGGALPSGYKIHRGSDVCAVRRAGALRGGRVPLRDRDAGVPDAAAPAVPARRLRAGPQPQDGHRAQLPLHAAAALVRARPRPARAQRQLECCTRRRAAGARAGRGAPCPTACRPTPASSSTAGARPGTPRNDSSSVRSLRPRPLRLSAAAALAAPANPIRPRRVIRCSPGTAPGVRSRVVSRKITVTVGCRDVYFVRIC